VRTTAGKPEDELDVRDLTFRAWVAWSGHHGAEAKTAYLQSTTLLQRALAESPDDRLATFLVAEFNLCDCVMGWSKNIEQQKAIGAAALERYLSMDPANVEMLLEKAALFQLRGRYDESLIIADSLLQQDPENFDASWSKAQDLLHMGRAAEALPLADALLERSPNRIPSLKDLCAAVHFAVGDYASASRLAQSAAAQMSEAALRSPLTGPVRLTMAAAEARLGHLDRARLALSDFAASVPNVTTIAAIRKWMYPTANLAGSDLLFEGLRLAGVKDQ
jgi:tetratricopeptide (TPR) repeat protein